MARRHLALVENNDPTPAPMEKDVAALRGVAQQLHDTFTELSRRLGASQDSKMRDVVGEVISISWAAETALRMFPPGSPTSKQHALLLTNLWEPKFRMDFSSLDGILEKGCEKEELKMWGYTLRASNSQVMFKLAAGLVTERPMQIFGKDIQEQLRTFCDQVIARMNTTESSVTPAPTLPSFFPLTPVPVKEPVL